MAARGVGKSGTQRGPGKKVGRRAEAAGWVPQRAQEGFRCCRTNGGSNGGRGRRSRRDCWAGGCWGSGSAHRGAPRRGRFPRAGVESRRGVYLAVATPPERAGGPQRVPVGVGMGRGFAKRVPPLPHRSQSRAGPRAEPSLGACPNCGRPAGPSLSSRGPGSSLTKTGLLSKAGPRRVRAAEHRPGAPLPPHPHLSHHPPHKEWPFEPQRPGGGAYAHAARHRPLPAAPPLPSLTRLTAL